MKPRLAGRQPAPLRVPRETTRRDRPVTEQRIIGPAEDPGDLGGHVIKFNFNPGYHLHVIQARRLALSPWGWRPGLVSSVDGLNVGVDYLETAGASLWHHEAIEELVVGLPVRVHEQYRALEIGDTWYHVALHHGLGPVPEPGDLDAWNDASSEHVVVELATGRAIRVGEPPW